MMSIGLPETALDPTKMKKPVMATHVVTTSGELMHVEGYRADVIKKLTSGSAFFYEFKVIRPKVDPVKMTASLESVDTFLSIFAIASVGREHWMDVGVEETLVMQAGEPAPISTDDTVSVDLGGDKE